MHNLVLETTRMSIELKNLKMRVESLTSRLEFNERRARALESVVAYKPSPEERAEAPSPRHAGAVEVAGAPGAVAPAGGAPPAGGPPGGSLPGAAPASGPSAEGPGQRSRRRRRRRGRRGGTPATALMGGAGAAAAGTTPDTADRPSQQAGADETADRDAAATDGFDAADDEPMDDPTDRRDVRPESMEQTFGSEAHPAEPVSGDPGDDPDQQ
jgi:hypothetical protein